MEILDYTAMLWKGASGNLGLAEILLRSEFWQSLGYGP